MVGARLVELAQQQVRTAEEHRVAGADGGRTQGLGQEGLADADRSQEEDVLPVGEETQGEELVQMTAVEATFAGCRGCCWR